MVKKCRKIDRTYAINEMEKAHFKQDKRADVRLRKSANAFRAHGDRMYNGKRRRSRASESGGETLENDAVRAKKPTVITASAGKIKKPSK